MYRRISWGAAVGFFAVAALASGITSLAGDEIPVWVWTVALAGFIALSVAMLVTFRDLLRASWTMSRRIQAIVENSRATERQLGTLASDVGRLHARVEGAARGFEDAITESREAAERMQHEQAASYRLLEAAITLNTSVELRSPLPPLRGTFAMGPDAAAYVIRTVLQSAPNQVVEVGSGVSTVLLASALADSDGTSIRSLDHDPEYAAQTLASLRANRLEHKVDLVLAPLTEVDVGGERLFWYDRAGLADLSEVGFVLVDGPPSSVGFLARYPAVPMLADTLAAGALIFIDDAERESETETIRLWASRFPVTVVDRPNLERGGVLLEWSG